VKAEHKKAHVTTQSVLKSEFKKSKTVTTLFSKCKGVLRSDVESDIAFYSLASPGHLYVEVDLVESGLTSGIHFVLPEHRTLSHSTFIYMRT